MNTNSRLYQDIATRTDGDIYVGVVGPVRTGKSTFIKNFMDLLVIPNIENSYKRERAKDELPQSAAGRTIMTTEPKFIPNEAVEINLFDNIKLRTRLVDCVGYLVDNAIGYLEDDMPRMVKTPWFDEEIPFGEAAELGTRKVIAEHSTIGILVTTDGSITDIPREDYIEAEERVVTELKELQKPFVIVLNSRDVESDYTQALAEKLAIKYDAPVLPIDCSRLDMVDVNEIFSRILYEFPVEQINIDFPRWINHLSDSHWIKEKLYTSIQDSFRDISLLKQIPTGIESLRSCDVISNLTVSETRLDTGITNIQIQIKDELFYQILSELSSLTIQDEADLFRVIGNLSNTKREYDKIASALEEVKNTGYGIVTPSIDELILDEPEMVKQGSRYGVKLKAQAPSIHMIRANIETEVSPIVGSEKQSEDLVNYLLSEFESDPKKIWDSNIFGKSLHELVNEGLQNKLCKMPEDAREKLQETLERIINEGSGGLICIIL